MLPTQATPVSAKQKMAATHTFLNLSQCIGDLGWGCLSTHISKWKWVINNRFSDFTVER